MKMEKLVIMMLCLVLTLGAAGCGNASSTSDSDSVNKNNTAGTQTSGVDDTESDNGYDGSSDSESNYSSGEISGESSGELPTITSADVDIDLTSMSSTMVYSEVYNMMYEPDGYIGKTIKMTGQFASYHDEETGQDYYACIIQDATACCAQGIEFITTDDYSYPDDYPKEGGLITVTGVFDTYTESDGGVYTTLRNARIL